jgi:hypothetical protein
MLLVVTAAHVTVAFVEKYNGTFIIPFGSFRKASDYGDTELSYKSELHNDMFFATNTFVCTAYFFLQYEAFICTNSMEQSYKSFS